MAKPYLADAPPPAYTLDDNLAAAYSPMAYQLEAGTSGQGAVLKVKADRFMRAIQAALPAIGCTPVLQNGQAKPPGRMCQMLSQNSVYMKPGDNLTVKTVKVESKKDKDLVHLELVDLSQPDSTPRPDGSPGYFHGAVDIEFPKGSLTSKDVAKVNEQVADAFVVTGLVATGGAAGGAVADVAGSGGSAPPPPDLNAVPLPAVAAAPQTLEEQLKTMYKLTTMGDGASVASRGTALTVTSDKLLLGTPYAKPAVCPASVVEGTPKPPAAVVRGSSAGGDYTARGGVLCEGPEGRCGFDQGGHREGNGCVRPDRRQLSGRRAECGSEFHTTVNFVFPKGYLESSDAGQVGSLVNSVLETPGQA